MSQLIVFLCRHPCPDGYYESASCNSVSDRVCSKCSSQCAAGKFLSGACGLKSDITCNTCSSPVCGEGSYRTACTTTSNSVCQTCSYPSGCPTGMFEARSCTPLTDRQCKACSGCNGNNYEVKACSGTTDSQCGYCMQGTNPLLDYFIPFNPIDLSAYSDGLNSYNQYCYAYNQYGERYELNAYGCAEMRKPYPPFIAELGKDQNYKKWVGEIELSGSYCLPFTYGSGTCREGWYESRRCSGRVESDINTLQYLLPYFSASVPWICSNPLKWNLNYNGFHDCTRCSPRCDPFR